MKSAPAGQVSPQRREEIIDSLRRGTVPRMGLDAFAVGLDGFEEAIDQELAAARQGRGIFKAVRGEYGGGKTFFARWLQERAKRQSFATSEVQISETETPLHKLETVYRRLVERLSTADSSGGALRGVLDAWFYTLEHDVLAEGTIAESDANSLFMRTNQLMEQRLREVNKHAPAFASVLRAYRKAQAGGSRPLADGLIAWLSGEPNVGADVKRAAAIKGEIDHFTAMGFLRGLLVVLKDSGYAGLVLVLDEIETLQRVRSDVRDKGLNALRQLMDEIDAGHFPGLYLLITGTSAFFDGPQGARRLAPLAQRLHVEFSSGAQFDNPRAVQIRLRGFDSERLIEVGKRIRDIYAQSSPNAERIFSLADDAYVEQLARAVTGGLGGKVGIAPRIFLKKLVGEVLDRIDQFPDFNPREHYALTLAEGELTEAERNLVAAESVDDIKLPS
jgi:hypothetical protein